MTWYETAFRSDYLRVYRHRDDESAAREVEFVVRTTAISPGDRVLDLACGAGRHTRPLVAAGVRVAAFDLSEDLLREAARQGVTGTTRGDMRMLPYRRAAFSAVASLFTSFGYFPHEEEDRRVLAEVSRVLEPGGRYLLDIMNRDLVLRTLVPRSVDRVEGLDLVQERWVDEERGRIEKAVTLRRPGCSDPVVSYVESVRLYAREEVEAMLADVGLEPRAVHGDFDGSAFAADSPRLLVVARRT